MSEDMEKTMRFGFDKEKNTKHKALLLTIYEALQEKGYNPINQLVGYLLSGDPAYITSHKNARNLIRKIERDDLLEELLKVYLERE